MDALDHLGRFEEGDKEVAAAAAIVPQEQRAGLFQGAALQRYRNGVMQESMADEHGGRHYQAIDLYRAALRLRPNYPEAAYNLANCLLEDGDLDGAIAAYHGAIALNPVKAEAHFNLAMALAQKNQRADALAEAQRVRELNPALYQKLRQALGSGP